MESLNYSGQISCSHQELYRNIESLWGKRPTEIHSPLLEVCRNSVLDRSTALWQVSHFHEGWTSTEDNLQSAQLVNATDYTSAVINENISQEK